MHRLKWKIAAIAILAALILVMNPELRALLLAVDALGLELVFILFAVQLRGLLPILRSVLVWVGLRCCAASFAMLRISLQVFGAVLPGRAMPGLSTLLYVWSRHLRCPLPLRAAESRLPT
jgi:hypothetical protein